MRDGTGSSSVSGRPGAADRSERHDHSGREHDDDQQREHDRQRALDECVADDRVELVGVLGGAERRLARLLGVATYW